jgi:hypothetical protein
MLIILSRTSNNTNYCRTCLVLITPLSTPLRINIILDAWKAPGLISSARSRTGAMATVTSASSG